MQIETSSGLPATALITYDELSLLFEPISLSTLAARSQFMKRQPKKITPEGFLFSFFQSVLSQNRALRNIAISAGMYAGCTISKQAVDYRINDRFVDFLERILAALVMQHSGIKAEWAQTNDLFRCFDRVLVQDSTTFPLDSKLVSAFPGPSNKYGQSATAKIQAVMDLLSEQFCHLELGAFTENDQSKAADILKIARPGDLVIRDLGYFVLSALQQMTQQRHLFLESATPQCCGL
ncbi:MAG: transposase [bacterium]